MCSNTEVANCPQKPLPEYAFIGRSNVGKSSLINMLVGQKALARISAQPGKTQLINHFLINQAWYLVDLPGYGYAKISKKDRHKWLEMIDRYIFLRANLTCLFVLIDSRIKPQKNDLEFMEKLGLNQIPFAMVFTKTDKLSKTATRHKIEAYSQTMLETWESLPPLFASSAKTQHGRDQILDFIKQTNTTLQA